MTRFTDPCVDSQIYLHPLPRSLRSPPRRRTVRGDTLLTGGESLTNKARLGPQDRPQAASMPDEADGTSGGPRAAATTRAEASE